MAQFLLLGLQVTLGETRGLHDQRNALNDLDPLTTQALDLVRIVGHQTDFRNAEILQYLGTETVGALIGLKAQLQVGFHGINSAILKLVSIDFIQQSNAPSFLHLIDKNAGTCSFNLGQCLLQLLTTFAFQRV